MDMEFWNEIRYAIEEMDYQHEEYEFLAEKEYQWECPFCDSIKTCFEGRRLAIIGLVSHCLTHEGEPI